MPLTTYTELCKMSDEQKFSSTVMPKEDHHKNLGGPGLQIPTNAADIKEFSETSKVDAKDLNAKIKAQAEAGLKKAQGKE